MSTPRAKRIKPTAYDGSPAGKAPKWKEAVSGQLDDVFVPYAPSKTFAAGDFVAHGKFGKGVVLTIEDGKMFVLFEEGIKKLLQGISG